VELRAFPILPVRDLGEACRFYEQLGFVATYRFPDDDPVFVALDRGASSLGLAAGTDASGGELSYWVYVEDVDAVLARLQAGGATVVAPAEDKPWGERVASVRDPAGHLVHLGSAG
jgi:uncharacterized glyoxalase superfamily protein PhnB